MKGRKIDLATANDALILDTFDLIWLHTGAHEIRYVCACGKALFHLRSTGLADASGGRPATCASGTFCEQNEPLKPCLK